MNDTFKCKDCGAARSYINQYCPICESSGPHIFAGDKSYKLSPGKTARKMPRHDRLEEESPPKSKKKQPAKRDPFDDVTDDSDVRSVLATKSPGLSKSTRRNLTYGALALLLVIIIVLGANTIISGVQKLVADVKWLTASQTSLKPPQGNNNSVPNSPQNQATNSNSENTSSQNSAAAANPAPDKPEVKPPPIVSVAPVADTTKPRIVGQPVASANDISATISWKTDEKAISQVRYGYGTAYQFQSAKTAQSSNTHSIFIDGLSPDTTYHYQVISWDAAGNDMLSADYVFRTESMTDAAPYISSRAPNFTLNTLDGKEVSLSQYRGKKVILNFWASWCSPCKIEFPHFQAVWDKLGSSGDLVLLTVAGSQSDESVIRSYIASNNFTFIVCLDSNETAFNRYSLTSIPKTFFLDKSGVIRRIQQGMFTSPGEVEFMLNSY